MKFRVSGDLTSMLSQERASVHCDVSSMAVTVVQSRLVKVTNMLLQCCTPLRKVAGFLPQQNNNHGFTPTID